MYQLIQQQGRELKEIEFIKKEMWYFYLTDMFKKDEQVLPEHSNIITDGKTEITETEFKLGNENLKKRKFSGKDQITNKL